jgi:hypothetical protein
MLVPVAHVYNLSNLISWEAEIRKIEFRSQFSQIVQETLSWKYPIKKKRKYMIQKRADRVPATSVMPWVQIPRLQEKKSWQYSPNWWTGIMCNANQNSSWLFFVEIDKLILKFI